MNEEDFTLNFPNNVLSFRVSIALSKLGLNEFYASFKYLRELIIHIIETKSVENSTILEALEIIQEKHNLAKRTLMNAFAKIFGMCPSYIFENPSNKKIGFYYKVKVICAYVLREIKKHNMAD